MIETETEKISRRLSSLRDELVEQAYQMGQRGRPDAADAVMAAAQQITELCAELEGEALLTAGRN